jgi:hypothetical protein
MFALPRFTMTDSFADLDRFRLTANALPLPVSDISPQDPYLKEEPLATGFSVHESLTGDLGSLSCFSSVHGQPELEIIGNRIELRHEENFDQNRIRINCTLPGPTSSDLDAIPRWRWFGMLLSMQDALIEEIDEVEEEYSKENPDSIVIHEQAALP